MHKKTKNIIHSIYIKSIIILLDIVQIIFWPLFFIFSIMNIGNITIAAFGIYFLFLLILFFLKTIGRIIFLGVFFVPVMISNSARAFAMYISLVLLFLVLKCAEIEREISKNNIIPYTTTLLVALIVLFSFFILPDILEMKERFIMVKQYLVFFFNQ